VANNSVTTFLSVGSLDKNKDHQLLISGFAAHFRGRQARLRIAGDGPLRRTLISQTARLGISHQVEFLGRMPREEVWREMARADCLVLTSRYETFGVVLIEALACGTPVVATKVGAAAEIVTAESGYLVNPDDERDDLLFRRKLNSRPVGSCCRIVVVIHVDESLRRYVAQELQEGWVGHDCEREGS